ncbi:hypothetical protein H8A97_25190 [Bradyrhizobium sp. Arg62]|uniref:hypothetical protein n=1 Tax=Bradyrhizobium TaxID=374 RepID=UPI001E363285|nr:MULTISPECIES: hypothetical protein [Bradyrhizobium]MCC8938369.1 hypothetical protein [Bradyrhizobium ivorense]MCC8948314.1 hypothetical protein [Bradyrhizobium brasilense]
MSVIITRGGVPADFKNFFMSRLKAHKQLSVLYAALQAHHDRRTIKPVAHIA